MKEKARSQRGVQPGLSYAHAYENKTDIIEVCLIKSAIRKVFFKKIDILMMILWRAYKNWVFLFIMINPLVSGNTIVMMKDYKFK